MVVETLHHLSCVSLPLLGSVVLQPFFVPRSVTVSFSLVQEEADAAEAAVAAEGAAELLQLGVSAVLVVLQGLSVAGGVRAVPAPEGGRLALLP